MLLQMLIELLTKPGDVVFDVNASIGRIVHVFIMSEKITLFFAILSCISMCMPCS